MRFTGRGRLATAPAPCGCTGAGFQGRAGTPAGTPGFQLVADTSYFRMISKRSLAARIGRVGGDAKLECGSSGSGGGGGAAPAGGAYLYGAATAGDTVLIGVSRDPAGKVTENVYVGEDQAKTAPAQVFHIITAPASASAFTVAPGLATAHVDAAGPFLSGSLDFAAQAAYPSGAVGSLTGSFAAAFDSYGRVAPAVSGLQGVLAAG